jgi:hypothetical protein
MVAGCKRRVLKMPTPGEHKTVQARMLEYAEAIRLRPAIRDYGGQVDFEFLNGGQECPRAFLLMIRMLNTE